VRFSCALHLPLEKLVVNVDLTNAKFSAEISGVV
jgi:hypothetical protein